MSIAVIVGVLGADMASAQREGGGGGGGGGGSGCNHQQTSGSAIIWCGNKLKKGMKRGDGSLAEATSTKSEAVRTVRTWLR